MSNIKQVILFRTDLNLPKGLSEAQVAHLHANIMNKLVFNFATSGSPNNMRDYLQNFFKLDIDDIMSWLKTPYTFVHGVPNKEVLDHFIKIAEDKKIIVAPWYDTIYVQVSGTQKIVVENCLIGVAILEESDKIKAIIGDLPLLS